jgi:hypothetical protein
MTDNIPEFETDEELEAWFDRADLASLDLVEALEVQIAKHVQLVVDEPWDMVETGSASTATSGHIEAPPVLT